MMKPRDPHLSRANSPIPMPGRNRTSGMSLYSAQSLHSKQSSGKGQWTSPRVNKKTMAFRMAEIWMTLTEEKILMGDKSVFWILSRLEQWCETPTWGPRHDSITTSLEILRVQLKDSRKLFILFLFPTGSSLHSRLFYQILIYSALCLIFCMLLVA